MRSLRAKVMLGVAVAALVVAFWAFFAPTNLGGTTTYTVTDGISMEPLLHKNSLAIVRAQSSYQVGDIVLYESQVLHKPVLHRIILIQDGDYFFKGDNNDFVDPGYATLGELKGKLWVHVPKVGGALSWFGKPAHAALLAVMATLLVTLSGSSAKDGRRRRKGRRRRRRRLPSIATKRR